MRRREFITLLGSTAVAWPLAARAQQPTIPVVGFLRPTRAEESGELVAAVRQGLRESGYPNGKVAIESRWADGQPERLPILAAELVTLQVAAIVASIDAARAAKTATARGPDEIYTEMASLMPSLDNISWERVQRESAVTYPADAPDKPGHAVVFEQGFPRPGGFGKLVAAKLQPPDETPNEEYPFILTTSRQLEHWHTGAMTRRATTLDALEPSAVASVSRGTIAKLGVKPGDPIRVSTRRGVVELAARQDDAIPDGVVFIPFAFVEAAANLLTNPALDPFGKIPEFKYCAARVEAVDPAAKVAAE